MTRNWDEADKFIDIQTLDGRGTLHPLLLPMDEDGHMSFPVPSFFRLLRSGKFSLRLFHAGGVSSARVISASFKVISAQVKVVFPRSRS
jgi:hypothetical protein